jgi:hypothetical protein
MIFLTSNKNSGMIFVGSQEGMRIDRINNHLPAPVEVLSMPEPYAWGDCPLAYTMPEDAEITTD